MAIYFLLYLSIVGSSVFIFEHNLYSLKTSKHPTGRRVCLVIIDGLRYDAVTKMDFLSKISSTSLGIMYKSLATSPSESRPGYERIITGTDSPINGIKNNKSYLPSLTPNLFYISNISGLKTAASGFYWIKELYPIRIDREYYYYIKDGATFSKAIDFINTDQPDFILIHPMAVDNAGHKYGGRSNEYDKSVKKLDEEIERTWNLIKDKGYTMLITSDHGHRDEGGHGDMSKNSIETPLIIIDKNLSSLNPAPSNIVRKQTDIAPTICDILGIPKSIYMYGNSLVAHSREIYTIRQQFASKYINDFERFFKATSIITYLITASYTVIFMSGCFMAAGILNRYEKR
ncbi:type I phosphodiesterase/nucleotide pyrophosphatase [Fonticella tunisiensis]|uniref:Type I phosphodiesterase/nucleotide pyrophosphatase n=1 Tax=Fonticella tunisiensis TaxID=1096341 RepID=A0A4R7K9H0_9CLOT|nr:type I phosphodiesterase/nucleotide pyrophosphatase [Fonticella tunisiensis]